MRGDVEEYVPRNVEISVTGQAKSVALTRKRKIRSDEAAELLRLRDELEQLKADKSKAEMEAARLKAELKMSKENEINLRCAICLRDRPCSPAIGCPNGHVFCGECLHKWGTAGRKVQLNTNQDGCHPMPTIKDPLYRCPSCREECDLFDVKFRFPLPAAVLAFVDPAVCPHCDCDVARGEGQHIFQCPAEKVTCPQCSKQVVMGRLQSHVFSECDQFSCKLCIGGTMRFTLDRLHNHMSGHDSIGHNISEILKNWPTARTAIEGIHRREMQQSEYTGMQFHIFFGVIVIYRLAADVGGDGVLAGG